MYLENVNYNLNGIYIHEFFFKRFQILNVKEKDFHKEIVMLRHLALQV